jgi:hypothetical protein
MVIVFGRDFGQGFALEDAIGSHACSLEASMRVTNDIPLGCSLPPTGWHFKFRPNTEGITDGAAATLVGDTMYDDTHGARLNLNNPNPGCSMIGSLHLLRLKHPPAMVTIKDPPSPSQILTLWSSYQWKPILSLWYYSYQWKGFPVLFPGRMHETG